MTEAQARVSELVALLAAREGGVGSDRQELGGEGGRVEGLEGKLAAAEVARSANFVCCSVRGLSRPASLSPTPNSTGGTRDSRGRESANPPPPLLSNCREAIAGEVRSAMVSAGVIGARLAAAHTTNASICAEAAEGQRKLAEFAALFAARGLDAPDSSTAVGSEGGGGVGSGRAGGEGDDRQELEQRLRDIAGEAAAASAAAEEMQRSHAAANATITAEAVDALGR